MRPGIGSLEKAAEQPPDKRTQRNAEHDRRRDAQKVRGVGAAALRRVQKRCKQHNDEDIVARCAGQDHLRDALVRSAAAFHQLHHARHDDRGRHRREHRAHDRRLRARDAEEARREQHIADDLARCGQARHQDRRTADLFEVAQIERQSRLEQDDNERELAQVG